jgi:hypothetical protein
VLFRRQRDNKRHIFSLDFLLQHLVDWELGARAERRLSTDLRQRLLRRH